MPWITKKIIKYFKLFLISDSLEISYIVVSLVCYFFLLTIYSVGSITGVNQYQMHSTQKYVESRFEQISSYSEFFSFLSTDFYQAYIEKNVSGAQSYLKGPLRFYQFNIQLPAECQSGSEKRYSALCNPSTEQGISSLLPPNISDQMIDS